MSADDLAKIEASLSFQKNSDGPVTNFDQDDYQPETHQEQLIKEELNQKNREIKEKKIAVKTQIK